MLIPLSNKTRQRKSKPQKGKRGSGGGRDLGNNRNETRGPPTEDFRRGGSQDTVHWKPTQDSHPPWSYSDLPLSLSSNSTREVRNPRSDVVETTFDTGRCRDRGRPGRRDTDVEIHEYLVMKEDGGEVGSWPILGSTLWYKERVGKSGLDLYWKVTTSGNKREIGTCVKTLISGSTVGEVNLVTPLKTQDDPDVVSSLNQSV